MVGESEVRRKIGMVGRAETWKGMWHGTMEKLEKGVFTMVVVR